MKQASSLPSYNFLFLGRSSGVWRRTAPVNKHNALMQHLHKIVKTRKRAGACEQMQTECKQLSTAGHHQQCAQKNNTSTCTESALANSALIVWPSQMLGSLKRTYSGSGVQVVCRGESTKTGVHTHTHDPIRHSVLTVLLEDPGDCFMHILLQFCTVKAEAALEGDQTNSLC